MNDAATGSPQGAKPDAPEAGKAPAGGAKLFVVFQLGRDRYALPASAVVEVLPLVAYKQLPQAPRGVPGVFDYRGAPVPLIDLSELALGQPAAARFSTRIILVNYPARDGRERLLGLIAERASRTVWKAPGEFVSPGVAQAGAPYLGPVAADPEGLLQRVDLPRLLPDEVQEALFQP